MCSAAEFEHRIVRGRQIVARQRELAAELGNVFPIAVVLLGEYEKSLALLEDGYRRYGGPAKATDEAVCEPSAPLVVAAPNCPSPADPIGPDQDEQMRSVALILEILRGGGYHCELAEETMH